MKAEINWHDKKWEVNLGESLPISIPIKEGDQNPNCYFSDEVTFETITGEGFVGDIKQGGTVNHKKVFISPHGNGTHTECYSHIAESDAVIADQLKDYFHVSQVISVCPINKDDDLVIDQSVLKNISLEQGIKALIIRTLPNDLSKLNKNYSGTNPPYLSDKAIQLIVDHGIEHLIVDLPSVDKEQDEGKLLAHKTFWLLGKKVRKNATITEMAFIRDSITDGIYLLNLQILPIHLDVSPSNPILFALIQL